MSQLLEDVRTYLQAQAAVRYGGEWSATQQDDTAWILASEGRTVMVSGETIKTAEWREI